MAHVAEFLPDSSLTGAIVERRYRIGARLGGGAAGNVYRARALAAAIETHGLRSVAIKVLAARHARDEDTVARFTHEAFLGTRLIHPNLVRVVDFGSLPDGRPYYAMELCRGAPLDRLLRAAAVLPARVAAALVRDAACALEFLHAHGIVHRDIKPANLCVTGGRRARLRLLDLGVAGVWDARRARRLGSVDVGARGGHGTPAYIAPEQALGAAVDPRADVYALACVAYRMLTGADAFRCSTLEATVRAHLFDPPRAPSLLNGSLPPAVDDAILRALEKDRDVRTPSAARFAAELTAAIERRGLA